MSEKDSANSSYKSRLTESLLTKSSFQQLPALNVPCQIFPSEVRTVTQPGVERCQTPFQNTNQSSHSKHQNLQPAQFRQGARLPERDYHAFANPTLVSDTNSRKRTVKSTPSEEPTPSSVNMRR